MRVIELNLSEKILYVNNLYGTWPSRNMYMYCKMFPEGGDLSVKFVIMVTVVDINRSSSAFVWKPVEND